jgi:hypothetical protein
MAANTELGFLLGRYLVKIKQNTSVTFKTQTGVEKELHKSRFKVDPALD